MQIQVFGTGCKTCHQLYESTQKAVAELQLVASVEYITDIQAMVEKGFMQSPVLVVNGEIAHIGSALQPSAIKKLLAEIA